MFKVAVIGAESPQGGELIRILIHHPEIELTGLFSPPLVGRSVSSIHHGLIGEMPLAFSDKIDLEQTDLLISIEDSDISKKLLGNKTFPEELFVISKNKSLQEGEIGLSEINRKTLVRGAKFAFIPSPAAVVPLVSLVPLAYFLLLNSDIDIEMTLPKDIVSEIDIKKEVEIIEGELRKRQTSFNGKINLNLLPAKDLERGAAAEINIQSSVPIEEIEKIFNDIYDDHNFTFLSRHDVLPREVEGTQKIVINLSKPDRDTLKIKAVADSRLRGGAGDIVHVLNLFLGLYEKTGLNLKPSRF